LGIARLEIFILPLEVVVFILLSFYGVL